MSPPKQEGTDQTPAFSNLDYPEIMALSGDNAHLRAAKEDQLQTGNDDCEMSYQDHSSNDLGTISASALIVADCLGTGILALPADIKVLGRPFGLAFLLFNLPINLYAGTILSRAAAFAEERIKQCTAVPAEVSDWDPNDSSNGGDSDNSGDGLNGEIRSENMGHSSHSIDRTNAPLEDEQDQGNDLTSDKRHQNQLRNSEVHTSDFIGLTTALYHNPLTSPDEGKTRTLWPTRTVTAVYYTNIFLVLGNYILVMSHSVMAFLGEENICLPTAGIVASALMYALCQMRTMASLGRSASIISLLSLFVVVGICLVAIAEGEKGLATEEDLGGRQLDEKKDTAEDYVGVHVSSSSLNPSLESIPRQLASIASIGFAVGSQKLLLNIRHEMAVKNECAPKALGISLFLYGFVYVTVCALAGQNPPALLFDSIDEGPVRKFAGFLLWIHVAVSYAINSQALTSSIDRLGFHNVKAFGLHDRDRTRWAVLTLLISTSLYLVANAIPFFKDLVALIGALTSVPLTLLLPAILYRRVAKVPTLFMQSRHDLASFLLVAFSLVFLVCGLFGALDSIELDWQHHGKPFACS